MRGLWAMILARCRSEILSLLSRDPSIEFLCSLTPQSLLRFRFLVRSTVSRKSYCTTSSHFQLWESVLYRLLIPLLITALHRLILLSILMLMMLRTRKFKSILLKRAHKMLGDSLKMRSTRDYSSKYLSKDKKKRQLVNCS